MVSRGREVILTTSKDRHRDGIHDLKSQRGDIELLLIEVPRGDADWPIDIRSMEKKNTIPITLNGES